MGNIILHYSGMKSDLQAKSLRLRKGKGSNATLPEDLAFQSEVIVPLIGEDYTDMGTPVAIPKGFIQKINVKDSAIQLARPAARREVKKGSKQHSVLDDSAAGTNAQAQVLGVLCPNLSHCPDGQ